MPRNSNDAKQYFRMQRTEQITESHCGPAVIQMLLSNVNVPVTQGEVAQAGGAEALIELNGMRVDQLAQAVRTLAPQAQFWYKDHATLDDATRLVAEYRYPVGIEWQGIFDAEGQEIEDPQPDYGHYSVITFIDKDKDVLIIVDPYKSYATQDRIFTLSEFEARWYDYNAVPDSATGQSRSVEDFHMMFTVTPREETFPEMLGMQRG
ncbi:MAG: hypothetical protein IT324_27420 [Anaerolineae bacterium]|nr:hypothetical protein [Anaerolineae bacterium]